MAESITKKISLPHLPELDALRTFAVLLTLLAHWSPIEIPYAWYGVDIFFTISGFLITSILIITYNNNQSVNRIGVIKNFMIRRTLRLFPIYYLFLVFFFFAKNYLNLSLWQSIFTPYFFTYTPNFLLYKIGLSNGSCFSHLWSLGVEEQFYLVWPWILLFTPSKYRISVISIIVFISLSAHFTFYSNQRIHLLPFTNLHTLGLGALLACFYTKQGAMIIWLRAHCNSIFYISFAHLITVLCFFNDASPFWHLYREISLCICTFSFVLVSIFGWKGIVGFITRNKQIQYIGTISYGIYLFHMPIPYLYRAIINKMHINYQLPNALQLLIFATATIVIASLSYKFIETPFLKLKRLFV